MKRNQSTIYTILLIFMVFAFGCKSENKTNDIPKEDLPLIGDTDIDFITKEIAKDATNPNLHFDRAQLLYNRKMYNEATADMILAIKLDSLNPSYYHLLSDIFMDNNISNKSLQTMKVAAGLFPERTQTLLKLAETHYIVKQYDESISALNSILRYDPQNAEAYFMLGLNFRSMGDIDRALMALQTSTEFDAKLIDAWLVLSEVLEAKGNDKALTYLETATSIEPDNVNALHSLAFYKQNHKDVEGALEIYRKINDIDKNYTDAYLNAGILYLEEKKLEKAKEQFDIMVSLAPLNPIGHYYKAYTAYESGDIQSAKISAQNALNLDSNFERAQDLLKLISEN